jgi:hypothetical protein
VLECARQTVPGEFGDITTWIKPPRVVPLELVRETSARMDVAGHEVRVPRIPIKFVDSPASSNSRGFMRSRFRCSTLIVIHQSRILLLDNGRPRRLRIGAQILGCIYRTWACRTGLDKKNLAPGARLRLGLCGELGQPRPRNQPAAQDAQGDQFNLVMNPRKTGTRSKDSTKFRRRLEERLAVVAVPRQRDGGFGRESSEAEIGCD